MQRIFFLKNFYTESLTLFYCVPFRIFFLEPTKLSLTCPASIYVIASTRHDGNRGAGGKCNFNFRISWKFNLKQIVKQTFKTWNQFRLLSGVITNMNLSVWITFQFEKLCLTYYDEKGESIPNTHKNFGFKQKLLF